MKKIIIDNLKFKILIFLLAFFLSLFSYHLSLRPAFAQTVDPSAWQTGATGLRTSSNTDKKTAGLTTTIKASGIPFINIQGGMHHTGWNKGGGPTGIDLGEIKIPGTTPALTSEVSDWSHNQMTFSNNLNIWVSRLSPAALIQNLNNSLRLFSGNLSGATVVPGSSIGEPWQPLSIRDRTPGPALPKYIAYQSGGIVRVQQIPSSSASALNLPTLDNNWILVWFGNNSYFTDSKLPITYGNEYASIYVSTYESPNKYYQADAPMLLKFQNNPTGIKQTTEGGIDLTFSSNSGYASMMPLFGREHLKASDTESWSAGLPANVTQKINFWNTNNRLCSYPTTVTESYAYDNNTDTSTISENITYLNTCVGGSTTSGFAILPPSLSLAKDVIKANITGVQVDANYSTEFGPIIGIDNTNTYSYSVSGLKKYTDSKRVVTAPDNVPPELIADLVKQVDEVTKDGHYLPWIFSDHLPRNSLWGDIYFLNPADTILALSEIIPVLPEPQKTNLIDYIKSERSNFPPETLYNLPNSGTVRTPVALNNYTGWQQYVPAAFLKKVPLYNLLALSKYYDLTKESVPAPAILAAKTILNQDMAEQDWASMSWFKGFSQGRVAIVNTNRHLAGLLGFVQLSKASGDQQAESLGRSLFTKAAIARIAMAKYPGYQYSANLINLPAEADWMGKYQEQTGFGNVVGIAYLYNYSWTGPNDDATQVVIQNQFGTYLFDASGFFSPGPINWGPGSEWFDICMSSPIAYRDLVPETFRLLGDFAKQESEIYLNKYTTIFPNWFSTFAESVLGAEKDLSNPIASFQFFMAKALLVNDSPQNLRTYKSVSWLDSGDFFYMNKLAETIKAYQGVKWEDELASPTPTPVPCTLASAFWSTNTITQGTSVNLNVAAGANCTNQQVTFEVRRNGILITDIAATTQPPVANLSNGQAQTSWVAEYNPLIPGTNPQYYFKAATVGGNTIESNPRLLTVNPVVAPTPTPTPIPTAANDWPQVQKDPQHTGYSSETLGTNIRPAWTYAFQPDKIYPQTQAIIYQGKVFVGTEGANGQKPTLYAFDAVNPDPAIFPSYNYGTGKVIWKFEAGGSILNSVAAYDNKVFFGSMDGAVYAVDANTGTQVWKQQLSQRLGFSTAPVIADNKVMIGGQDGHFYALNPNNGQVIWNYNASAPIFQTAAYDKGKVFFGTQDMYFHAVNTADGTLAWKSTRLKGIAMKDYWPMIYQGRVIVRPWADQTDASREPTFFSLDENDGSFDPSILIGDGNTMNGAASPPCIDRDDNIIIPGNPIGGTWQSGWDRYNLTTKAHEKISAMTGSQAGGWGNGDENMNVTCSHNLIFTMHTQEANAHYTGAYNLDTKTWIPIPSGVRNGQMGSNTQGGGGNPASISNGMIYHITFHELIVRSAN